MAVLDRVVDALEEKKAASRPKEVQPVDLLPILKAIKELSDLSPVLEAINAINIPEPKEVDLKPVLDAINKKDFDLGPLISALNAIKMPEIPKPEPRIKEWLLTHERTRGGAVFQTRAKAVIN